MARPLRIEYPGAYYHVMNRGRGRMTVFPGDEFRADFLQGLAEAHARFGIEVHAFCLMGNHYHLLLATPRGNLARAMRHIDGLYTQRHNRRARTDGPLFRGRYKAVLVDETSYLLQVSRYIHRNPVETRTPLVRRLSGWRWSSYRAYVGKEKPPAWLATGEVLGAFGSRRSRAAYGAYVEAGNEAELMKFYGAARLAPVLGDEDFQARAARRAQTGTEVSARGLKKPVPLAEILNAACAHFDVPRAGLVRTARGRGARNLPRAMAMKLCRDAGGLSLAEIAAAFHVGHYATVSKTIARLEAAMEEEPGVRRVFNVLSQDLTP